MKKQTLFDILNNFDGAVGVDIDDSMVPLKDELVHYINLKFKDRLKYQFRSEDYTWMVLEDVRAIADAGITRQDVSYMLKAMESDSVIEHIMPRLHCIASLKVMAWTKEVYMVTSRGDNYYNDPVGMTNRWLDNVVTYYNYIPDKVIFDHNKEKVAHENNIGLFFEDNPLVAAKLLDAGIPVILFNTLWNNIDNLRDRILLTEKAYIQKKEVIAYIEKYLNTLLFRVPDWSHIVRNLK